MKKNDPVRSVLAVLFVLECTGAALPVAPFSLGFFGAILAVTVMCVSDIWVGVMLIALFVTLLVRYIADKKEEDA